MSIVKNNLKQQKKLLTKKNIVQAKFGDITDDYFFCEKPIGSGGYGTVYRAIHKQTGIQRAIKLIKSPVNLKMPTEDGKRTLHLNQDNFLEELCREIEMLIKIDHNNIVNIFEYYLYTHDIFIVMEFLDGGELFKKIVQDTKFLTETSIRKIMREVLGAVAYMHGQNIGNILEPRLRTPMITGSAL